MYHYVLFPHTLLLCTAFEQIYAGVQKKKKYAACSLDKKNQHAINLYKFNRCSLILLQHPCKPIIKKNSASSFHKKLSMPSKNTNYAACSLDKKNQHAIKLYKFNRCSLILLQHPCKPKLKKICSIFIG